MQLAIMAILTRFQQETFVDAECDSINRWKAAKRLHQTEKTTKNNRSQMKIVFYIMFAIISVKKLKPSQ